jgi:hypothetical protein
MFLKVCNLECLSTPTFDKQPMFQTAPLRVFSLQFSQTSNCRANSYSRSGRKRISSSSDSLTAGTTRPNSSAGTLHGVLSAKDTMVSRVLGDFNLSQKLTQSRTISGSVLSCDSDLLRASSHFDLLDWLNADGNGWGGMREIKENLKQYELPSKWLLRQRDMNNASHEIGMWFQKVHWV